MLQALVEGFTILKVIDPGSLDRAGAKSLLRWSMEGLRSGKKEPRSRKARKEV